MAVAVSRARNIQKSVTFDRERYDAVAEMARGMGVSFSAAVHRLIDLHAGKVLDALEVSAPPVFEVGRWRERRLSRELVAEVAGAVRDGATRADAYRRVEVSVKAGDRWERRGREDMEKGSSSLYADLVASIERDRAEFNGELIVELRRSGGASAERLLKMLDDQFNPVSRSTVDVTHRWQMLLDWDLLTLSEAKTLGMLMRKASPSGDDRAVTSTARPAVEAVPVEVVELLDAEEGEWTEAPALEPGDEKPEA